MHFGGWGLRPFGAVRDWLLAFFCSPNPVWLAAVFTYTRQSENQVVTRPAWQLVTHMFNHQTHHRGQITTMLSQFGVDPGVTDLPAMPV